MQRSLRILPRPRKNLIKSLPFPKRNDWLGEQRDRRNTGEKNNLDGRRAASCTPLQGLGHYGPLHATS
jgi:hypothetical protein